MKSLAFGLTALLLLSGLLVVPIASAAAPPPSIASLSPSVGATLGGTLVTITGAGFSTAAAAKPVVAFGSTTLDPLAVTVSSATSIIALAPPGTAGAVRVKVTNPDGQASPNTAADDFGYAVALIAAALSPTSGSTNGGTLVTVAGSGFDPAAGATTVVLTSAGAPIAGGIITGLTATATEVSFTAPAHPAGVVDVTVTSPGGQSGTLQNAFTYAAPGAPTLVAVTPSQGSTLGGTKVTLTGTGFVEGLTVSIGGTAVDPTRVTLASPTSIVLSAPARAAGMVPVSIANPGGAAATLADAFRYIAVPTITSVNPATGATNGGTVVTIQGTGFASGEPLPSVTFDGVPAVVLDGTSSSIFVVAPPRPDDKRAVDVVVVNPDGPTAFLPATATGAFTYFDSPVVACTGISTSSTPVGGPSNGGTTVTITGSGFDVLAEPIVTFGNAVVPADKVTVTSSTQLTVVSPPRAEAVGNVVTGVDVKVLRATVGSAPVSCNGSGSDFLYQPVSPDITNDPPGITSTQRTQHGGTSVTITGSNFAPGATVAFGSLAATDVIVVSAGKITAKTPPSAAGGEVAVTVTNPDGIQNNPVVDPKFTYQPANAPTTAGVLTPSTGSQAGGETVRITGTGFSTTIKPTVNFRIGGTDHLATVLSGSTSQVLLVGLPGSADQGTADVIVTNPDGKSVTKAGAFTYLPSATPAITKVSPRSGTVLGGTQIKVTGTGFAGGTTPIVKFGTGTCPAACADPDTVIVTSPTELLATAPPLAAGPVRVSVTNLDGKTTPDTAADEFTFLLTPTLTAASACCGTKGGDAVTLTGSNFAPGMVASFGGNPATPVTGASAVSSPHTAGVVGVAIAGENGLGSSLAAAATYVASNSPSLTNVAGSGDANGGNVLILSGSNFATSLAFPPTIVVGGNAATLCTASNVPVTGCAAPTAAALKVVAPPHATGQVDVKVTNPDGQSSTIPNGYNYAVAGSGAPTISSLKSCPTTDCLGPAAGSSFGGTSIKVTGTGFSTGSTKPTVAVGGIPVPPAQVTVTSTAVSFTTPPHTTPSGASVSIVVANPNGQAVSAPFNYIASPLVTSVSPATGPSGGGTAVALAGTGFTAGGKPSVFVHDSTPAAAGSVQDLAPVGAVTATSLGFTTVPHPAGMATLQLIGASSGLVQSTTLANAFEFAQSPPPTAGSIGPEAGTSNGGTVVTITGSGFNANAKPVVKFGDAVGTQVTVDPAGTTVTAVSPPCPDPCSAPDVPVTVTNPDGQQALAPTFTYTLAQAPAVSSLAPTSGLTRGGDQVIVSGTGFDPDAEPKVFFGAMQVVPADVTVNNPATITVKTPAMGGGAASVAVTVENPDGRVSLAGPNFAYLAADAPNAASVNPQSGSSNGGTTITLTGSGFSANAPPTVSFVAGSASCPAPPAAMPGSDGVVAAVSGSTVQLTTPVMAVGPVTILVRNPDGQCDATPLPFTISSAPAPTLASISPDRGAPAGGQVVTLTGTGFSPAALVIFDGVAATDVHVASPTQITATTPAHAVGAVTVAVVNSDFQTAGLTDGYTYNGVPTITNVAPSNGPTTGGTTVTLFGTNFWDPAVSFGGTPATAVAVTGGTLITATAPAHAAGTVDVTVTNVDDQAITRPASFTFLEPVTVTAVTPNSGTANGGTSVTITGTSFAQGATVTFGGAPATNVAVASATQITAKTPPHAAGAVSVVVESGGQSNPANTLFTYTPAPAPTLTGLTPALGTTNGNTVVTLTGTNLAPGATVTFGGTAGTAVTATAAGTSLTVTTPARSTAGAAPVVVTNPDGQQAASPTPFTYALAGVPAFAGTGAVSPVSGPSNGGTTVTLTGANFASGAKVTFGSANATSVTVAAGATSLTAVVPARTASAGPVDIKVTNPDGQSATLAGGYSYTSSAAPTLTAVTPGSGTAAGGTTVTLAGTNFALLPAAPPKVDFGGADATAVAVVSPTQVTATTPAHAAGPVVVKVTNPDGKAATLANAFTYAQSSAPVITAVAPLSGDKAGGTAVTLSGTNFVAGSIVTFGGVTASAVSVLAGGATLTAVTPAHAAGLVDVRVVNPDGQAYTRAGAFTYAGALTGAQIEEANKRIDVKVTRVGDSNLIEASLPTTGLPASVQGIQFWASNSPYVLLKGCDAATACFATASFTHVGVDAKATTKYLVTMYYGPSAELGLLSNTTAPELETYFGEASTSEVKVDLPVPLWAVIVLAVGAGLGVILMVVLTARRRRSQMIEPATAPMAPPVVVEVAAGDRWGSTWQPAPAAQSPRAAASPSWQPPRADGAQSCRCPSCQTSFTVAGPRPIKAVCPGCGVKGTLR